MTFTIHLKYYGDPKWKVYENQTVAQFDDIVMNIEISRLEKLEVSRDPKKS
jgi:hypothetical protein